MPHLRLVQLPLLLTFLFACSSAGSERALPAAVKQVLQQKCVRCHGPDEQNGDVRLDNLSPDLLKNRPAAETWHDVLNALNRGEMPPAEETQLTDGERSQIVDWIQTRIDEVIEQQRSTGRRVVLRRLNRSEYAHTMRDLLGVEFDYAANLPPDGVSPEGFTNNGASLGMSPLQLEYYTQAARGALRQAIVTGDKPQVFEQRFTESVTGKRFKQAVNNRLGRRGLFLARLEDYPTEGEFAIRVRAHAEQVAGQGWPRLRVTVGFRTDTVTPERELGVADVTASPDDPQVYELRGRIEQFPLPNLDRKQSKFPGLVIRATNAYRSSEPEPNVKRGKKKGKTPPPEDPNFPKVVIDWVEFVGPIFDQWPPAHHRQLLFEQGDLTDDEYALRVIEKFADRAFRGPADAAEVAAAHEFFKKIRPRQESIEAALRETLALILISPRFLYLVEPASPDRSLTNHQIATRLSYFLWNSMPDPTLGELADAGNLNDPKVVNEQVERMLADPKSWRFVKSFTNEWLDLDGLQRVAVNPEYYPDFNNDLKAEMVRETQHFFAEVLFKDLSALNFIEADFAMLNGPLARHYGVEGPRGGGFERVALDGEQRRGGLLSQASFLLANSTGEDSHPVKRGVWIRSRLLDNPPPPPPPNVPPLEAENPNFAKLPLKEQLKAHRNHAACSSCHRGIDPWGVALEQFDAVGLRRTEVVRRTGRGKKKQTLTPVDATTKLPDGSELSGVDDLRKHLLTKKKKRFARALTSKMLSYALGRSLELGDQPTVDRITVQFLASDCRLSKLIELIAIDETFRTN